MRGRPPLSAGRALILATGLIASAPAISAPAISAPAAAQDYRTRDVGDWTIAVSGDGGGCFVTRQYDGVGGTRLLLGLDTDGSNRLSVLNDNWSIAPGERLKLNFRLSGGKYAGHAVIGIESDGKRGFVTSFEAKFPSYFAASKGLDISRGTVPVEQLSLAGSGAAMAELRKCVQTRQAGDGDRKSARKPGAAIPRDPFAPAASRRSKR